MRLRPADGDRPLVLVVSHEASRTGAPKVARFVLDALRDLPVATMVVHRWGGPMKAELDAAAGRHRWEPGRRVRVALRRFGPTKPLAARWETLAIRLALKRARPALVWCNSSASAMWVPVARSLGIPVVLHVHELGPLGGPWLRRAGLTRLGDEFEVVACSAAAASDTAELLGRSDVAVLHSPVDVAAVRAAGAVRPPECPPEPLVVGCGRADRTKGADVVRAAAPALAARPGSPAVVWVGSGAEADAGGGPVRWIGERTDAAAWLGAATVVVVPSRQDAFPLVVLEAMALGRPIVASAVGGIPEQVGDTAILVPPDDPDALAAAVATLLGDPRRAAELGSAAAQRCEELWDRRGFDRQVRAIVTRVLGLTEPESGG